MKEATDMIVQNEKQFLAAEEKFQAAEAEAKRLLIEQEKSMKLASDRQLQEAEAEAKRILVEKEKSLQEAANKLVQYEKQLQELRFEVEKPLSLRALEVAVKTIRRTGLYGYD